MIRLGLFEGIASRLVLAIASLVCLAWIGLAGGTAYAAHPGDPLATGAAPAVKQDMVQVAQACPPGYNYYRGRCRSAHDRDYRGPSYRGGSYYGGACPPGYNWGAGRYDLAVFGRNITDEVKVTGGIDFNNLTGFINEPRTVGVEFKAAF